MERPLLAGSSLSMGKKETATGAQRAPVSADLTPDTRASSGSELEHGERNDECQQQWPEPYGQDH
jgi:hypothetical protein